MFMFILSHELEKDLINENKYQFQTDYSPNGPCIRAIIPFGVTTD